MDEEKEPKQQGILDTISFSQQNATLRAFNPQSFISEYLSALKPRERQVLVSRHGLEDGQPQTLEVIGKKLNLTRERVRQIEKEALSNLFQKSLSPSLEEGAGLIFQIIEEHGNILREADLIKLLLLNNHSDVSVQNLLFILNQLPRFSLLPESPVFRQSWYVSGFDKQLLENMVGKAKSFLEKAQKPQKNEKLFSKLRQEGSDPETSALTDEIAENYVGIGKVLDRNSFGEWGLSTWTDIHPKDISDKVFVVLNHLGKPEHYQKITELINKQAFDKRIAHKETVHNELIKDERFVLVGRGIYALRKWGYKKGVVADIIAEVLRNAAGPLTRDQIIEAVLKQRFVKKNTIIVGLSNRNLFRKMPDNKYTNVQ